MTTSQRILFWTFAFAVTHMGLSSMRIRPRIVGAVGVLPYLGIYSLLALGTFSMLVMTWLPSIHGGGMLWNVRAVPGVHMAALLVSWLSFTLSLAALVQPSPASIGPRSTTRARGLTRITRHPLFMNIGIWALAHAVLNGFVHDVLFFGGIFVFALAGCMHQDARKRITEKGTLDEFFSETSLLPFVAIATGRNRLVLSEMPWIGLAVAGAVSWAIYHFHPALFG